MKPSPCQQPTTKSPRRTSQRKTSPAATVFRLPTSDVSDDDDDEDSPIEEVSEDHSVDNYSEDLTSAPTESSTSRTFLSVPARTEKPAAWEPKSIEIHACDDHSLFQNDEKSLHGWATCTSGSVVSTLSIIIKSRFFHIAFHLDQSSSSLYSSSLHLLDQSGRPKRSTSVISDSISGRTACASIGTRHQSCLTSCWWFDSRT